MDEPVAGLDPYGIVQVRELLEERREAGRAVLVSSHILSEVERTADRISIIHRGHVLVEDSLDSIIRRLSPGAELEIELQGDIAVTEDALASLPGIRRIDRSGSVLVLGVEGDQDLRSLVSQTISKSGATVVGMKQRRASLEEAFVRLTEGKLRQAGLVTGEENPSAGEA
jgi:ABC-2 type transport system ATP-binding protein